jgi:cob(I)alamin adenosyltransferase
MKKQIDFDMVVTRGGDTGATSLFDGSRVRKCSLLINVIGKIDTLNAYIGVIRSLETLRRYDKNVLSEIQTHLYILMGIVSGYKQAFAKENVEFLDRKCKLYMKHCAIPNVFINFGDDEISSKLNLLRTIAREVERVNVDYSDQCIYGDNIRHVYAYFNRLSDLFYVMSLVYLYKAKKKQTKKWSFPKIFRKM